MTDVRVIHGNIFTTQSQTIVNTVNCVGVMGAGIALECRLRYPDMFKKYVSLCNERKIDVGILWLFKSRDHWILNFPTKKHWKYATKEQYIHAGLKKFMDTYLDRGIESIAFPLLGAKNGGLDPARSLEIMESYLCECTIPVEIYKHAHDASDELYEQFRNQFLTMSTDEVRLATGLRVVYIDRIRAALKDNRIYQLNQLGGIEGIGTKTLEAAFRLASVHSRVVSPAQESLFE